MMHQRKYAAAAVLMAGSLVFGVAPAQAKPDKPGTTAGSALAQVPPAQRERIVAQNKARAAATGIRSAIERTNPVGYTGIELYQGGGSHRRPLPRRWTRLAAAFPSR